MVTEWEVDAQGHVLIPKWEHVYEWSEWSDWQPRDGYPDNYQRTRTCLNGCGTEETQTEYRPKEA